MVDTMRGDVYSRAWYVLVFFTGLFGLMLAWIVLHRRDGFQPRGLVIWTFIGQIVMVAFVVAVYVWALVAAAMAPFDYLL